MVLSALPLLVDSTAGFIQSTGLETAGEALVPGANSVAAMLAGSFGLVNSGLVTLALSPVLAVILYRRGYRVAGPLLAVFSLGLFFARVLSVPA